MPDPSTAKAGWVKDEIVVFAVAPAATIQTGNLCLVQRAADAGHEVLVAQCRDASGSSNHGGAACILFVQGSWVA